MSDTPRTDAKLLALYGEFTRCFVKRNYENMEVPSGWACQLERELSESARKLEEAERSAKAWEASSKYHQEQLAEANSDKMAAVCQAENLVRQIALARKTCCHPAGDCFDDALESSRAK